MTIREEDAVWCSTNNTITSVVTRGFDGLQTTYTLSEPFTVPEPGWYRVNPDTMRMERA